MSFCEKKEILRGLTNRVRSANWLARAYGRAIFRSLTQRQRRGATRLAAIALSLLFFHFFPILVVASYMSWEGFFSYDMFREGLSGVAAFYWWAEAFLIVGSWYIAGSLYFVVESRLKHASWRPRSWFFWGLMPFNVILVSIFLWPDWNGRDGFTREHIFALVLVAAWIVIHIAIVFHAPGKPALTSLAIGVVGLTSLAMLHPGALALPYSWSLQFFGNGGGLQSSLRLAKDGAIIQGRLVLASPEHIYIYPDNKRTLLVIRRGEIEQLSIANLSGFGHPKPPKNPGSAAK